MCVFSLLAGSSVGAADEGAEAGGKAEEGGGAALQPAAHRVQPHALRDAHAGHPLAQVQAAQSHGEPTQAEPPLFNSLRVHSGGE